MAHSTLESQALQRVFENAGVENSEGAAWPAQCV